MKPSILYRIAAVLLLLFAIGHTSGFPWSDPKWGVDPSLMQSAHFNVFGSSRTYWDFYLGFGLFNSAFLLFAAILAWQLGGLPPETWARMRVTRWAFAACFAAIAVLTFRYFFVIPMVFSTVVTLCLISAAALSSPRNNA